MITADRLRDAILDACQARALPVESVQVERGVTLGLPPSTVALFRLPHRRAFSYAVADSVAQSCVERELGPPPFLDFPVGDPPITWAERYERESIQFVAVTAAAALQDALAAEAVPR